MPRAIDASALVRPDAVQAAPGRLCVGSEDGSLGEDALMPLDYQVLPLAFQRRIANSEVKFTEISPVGKVIPKSPDFIYGTFPADLSRLYFSRVELLPVGVYQIAGCKMGGDILLHRGSAYFSCAEANIHDPWVQQRAQEWRQPSASRRTRAIGGQTALIHGPGHKIFGHWLVEFVPKLFLLQAAGFDVFKLRYAMPRTIPGFAIDLLEFFGISRTQVTLYDPADEVLHLEQAIVPTIMHNGVRMSPLFRPAAAFLKALVTLKNGPLKPTAKESKLYLSRGASNNRKILNRPDLEHAAVQRGFSVVSPELLPLKEQYRLFSAAQMIVGEYGSALHWSMFAPPGAVVCALRGTEPHPAFIQSGLGACLSQPTGYVFGDMSEGPSGAFTVPQGDFERCLDTLGTATFQHGSADDFAPSSILEAEAAYIARYPDIAAEVQAGKIPSGRTHFVAHGAAEGRVW